MFENTKPNKAIWCGESTHLFSPIPAEHGHCVFSIISLRICVTKSSTEQPSTFTTSAKFTYISSQLTASTSKVYLQKSTTFFFLMNNRLGMDMVLPYCVIVSYKICATSLYESKSYGIVFKFGHSLRAAPTNMPFLMPILRAS